MAARGRKKPLCTKLLPASSIGNKMKCHALCKVSQYCKMLQNSGLNPGLKGQNEPFLNITDHVA